MYSVFDMMLFFRGLGSVEIVIPNALKDEYLTVISKFVTHKS